MDKKVTVVLIGKNDDYGGNLTHRFKHCLNVLTSSFDEIIYVDWNSSDKTLIEEIIQEIERKEKIKTYVVSKEDIKKNNPEYENYSIVEAIARNIGIRRASNDWILVSNVDILVENIDVDKFDKETMYTSARYDVPEDVHLRFDDTSKLLRHVKENINSLKRQPDSVVDGNAVWDSGDVWSLVVGCGDFQFAHKNVWYGIKGFEESLGGRCYADSNLMKKSFLNFNTSKCDVVLFHLNHGSSKKTNPNEILPMNDRFSAVNNFDKTTNPENWGWYNYNLKEL